MSQDQWYYCLVHHTVEPAEGCKAIERLGPYATREEAEQALQIAQARNEEWDNDPRFNDEDPDADDDDEGGSAFDALRP